MPATSTFGDSPVNTAAGVSTFGDVPVAQSQDQSQPGVHIVGTPFLSGIKDTASKFLKQMNVENLLDHIGQADSLAGQGRWADAWDTLKDVLPGSQDFLGNQQPFQPQKEFVQDTVDKFKQGDYSGGTANLLTVAAMNAHHAPAAVDALGRVTEGPRDVAATTAKGAVQGILEAHKGGVTNPRVATAMAAGYIPVIGPKLAATIEMANTLYGATKGAREVLAARRTAREAVEAKLAEEQPAAGAAPQPPDQPGGPMPSPPGPPPTSPTAGPTGPSPDLLDGIARAYLKKPYARLNAAEQVTVRLLASKVAGANASEAVPAAPQVSGPAPVVSPQEAPPALPAAPPAPGATRAPAATPVETPASPEAQALVPTAQSAVLPAAAAPPAPAESPSQLTGRMLVIPSAKGTAHVPEGAIEYYPGGGPAHIPTPGELGFGRYVPEGTPMDSSTLSHIQAENHKAFNAASYAFRQGIVDPSVLDDMTEAQKRDFMNEALAHGREVGNPTPKTKYQASREPGGSILGGHTLTLAKAHLQKMLDDGAAAPEELPPGGEPSGGTKFEQSGGKFLLFRRSPNFPGYDIVAVHPDASMSGDALMVGGENRRLFGSPERWQQQLAEHGFKPENVVGTASIRGGEGTTLIGSQLEVNPAYQRQGVATGMYNAAEQSLGGRMVPSESQSRAGAAFWQSRGAPGPAALEAGQAVVKGNLRKSLTDVLSDETGSVGKGSGIDPQTRKQLVDDAARLTSEVAEKVRKGVTTAKEAASRVAQGARQAVSPKTVSPAVTEAVRNGVEKSLNDYTKLLPKPAEAQPAVEAEPEYVEPGGWSAEDELPLQPPPEPLTDLQVLKRATRDSFSGLTSPEGKHYEVEQGHHFSAQDLGWDDARQAMAHGFVRWSVDQPGKELRVELFPGNRKAARQAQNVVDLLGHNSDNIYVDAVRPGLLNRGEHIDSQVFHSPEEATRYLDALVQMEGAVKPQETAAQTVERLRQKKRR